MIGGAGGAAGGAALFDVPAAVPQWRQNFALTSSIF